MAGVLFSSATVILSCSKKNHIGHRISYKFTVICFITSLKLRLKNQSINTKENSYALKNSFNIPENSKS